MNIDFQSDPTLFGLVGPPHKVQAFIPIKCGSLALKVFGLRAQALASLREPMHDAAEYNRGFNPAGLHSSVRVCHPEAEGLARTRGMVLLH